MKVKCACCNLPVAKIADGRLVLYAKHYGGEKHYTPLSVEDLERLIVVLRAQQPQALALVA